MANNDKIYLAYTGELGEDVKVNTHIRINWIVDQVGDSSTILDIGCSQGVTSLLLAEKGKKVVGVDIQEENIEFAKELLTTTFKDVQDNVEFICEDFMLYESPIKYDCIIITEVLEHLQQPDKFLSKAKSLLEEKGRMIITVPFGVLNHPDHYSTFYLLNFYKLVSKYMKLKEIHYMGKWMGTTGYLELSNNEDEFSLNESNINMLEENFLKIDLSMTKRIEELYSNSMSASQKYRDATQNYRNLKEKYELKISQYDILKNDINNLKNEHDTLKLKNDEYVKQITDLKKSFDDKANEADEYKIHIIDCLSDSENEAQFYSNLQKYINKLELQNNYLISENNEYKRKIQLIKDTFVGKICIKIYRILNKLKLSLRKN